MELSITVCGLDLYVSWFLVMLQNKHLLIYWSRFHDIKKTSYKFIDVSYLELLMSLQDVAVKVFSKQEYSKEVMQSFRQEVLFRVDCFECSQLKTVKIL